MCPSRLPTDAQSDAAGVMRVEGVDLRELARLAQLLALQLKRGDVVALHGDLGVGKTRFAQELIGAFAGGVAVEVVSPTFAIGLPYDLPRGRVVHFDLYRVSSPDELTELGFFDALQSAITLIEWPERAENDLPDARLDIMLEETSDTAQRTVAFVGHGGWAERVVRMRALRSFLHEAGAWADGELRYLQGDASARAYGTVTQGDAVRVLMDWPAQPDGDPIYEGKPYSQLVHLAESVTPFVEVAAQLRERCLSAPRIDRCDADHGFLLLEHLGNDLFYSGEDVSSDDAIGRYTAAIDVLVHLAAAPPEPGTFPPFDEGAQMMEVRLLPDWYWPYVMDGLCAPENVVAEFEVAWRQALAETRKDAQDWILRDFHSPNLLWLPERSGLARVGLIDFQDAMAGHASYDVVSLLQDARQSVPEPVELQLLKRYCAARLANDTRFDETAFRTCYAILGAQRATKILGIFARLCLRDKKPAYLAHMPRIWNYLERNLQHPGLHELKDWFDTHLPVERRARELRDVT